MHFSYSTTQTNWSEKRCILTFNHDPWTFTASIFHQTLASIIKLFTSLAARRCCFLLFFIEAPNNGATLCHCWLFIKANLAAISQGEKESKGKSLDNTVDGRNPAPVDMENIPLFTRFYTSQVVQDFFHQQYLQYWLLMPSDYLGREKKLRHWWNPIANKIWRFSKPSTDKSVVVHPECKDFCHAYPKKKRSLRSNKKNTDFAAAFLGRVSRNMATSPVSFDRTFISIAPKMPNWASKLHQMKTSKFGVETSLSL